MATNDDLLAALLNIQEASYSMAGYQYEMNTKLTTVNTKLDTLNASITSLNGSLATTNSRLESIRVNGADQTTAGIATNLGVMDLTWAVVMLFLALGLGIGFMMFGPKRAAIVEVA